MLLIRSRCPTEEKRWGARNATGMSRASGSYLRIGMRTSSEVWGLPSIHTALLEIPSWTLRCSFLKTRKTRYPQGS